MALFARMEAEVVVCARAFSREVLQRINAAVREHPQWSRAELARQVCEWLDWRSATGRRKEMSCRVALRRLHERGLIELPPARRRVCRRGPHVAVPGVGVPAAASFRGTVVQLRELELVRVDRAQRELWEQWKGLVATHHYLGYQPLCGAQVHYLVRCEHGSVGALAFSAAAWHLKARDRWIGWSPAARQTHLARVVCNSRFVLAGGMRVANLASKVLALAAHRLPADWQQVYGYAPLLLETYVERPRFRGTAYRAANWLHVGSTRGRGRQDRTHQRAKSIKDIYLYVVHPDWRARLCEEPGPARLPAGRPQAARSADWAVDEFATVRLRDRRLRQRLVTVAHDFYAHPEANVPQACGSRAKTKAAYRLFAHQGVSMTEILAAHYHATMERIARAQPAVVLAVQDTTSFNYTTHPDMEGVGPISTKADGAQGVLLHDTMAYTVQGTAMGLVDIQLWARDRRQFGKRTTRYQRTIEHKESVKWLKSFRAAARLQRQLGVSTTVISVGDREADVYELFVEALSDRAHPKVLVRAERDRLLEDGQGHLWDYVATRPVAARRAVHVPKRHGRPAREAVLELRFTAVQLQAPKRKRALGAVGVWAVQVKEVDPPSAKEAIEWLLLTTAAVSSIAQAQERVDWYHQRWRIEEYHRTLKSGCRIENRQLGDRTDWEKCLAIDLVVAWRVEHMKRQSRETPQAPCTVAFEDHQWRALLAFKRPGQPLPTLPPGLREITRLTAELGGFLGRNSDGEPGSTTLWRGLQRLQDIAAAWLIFTKQQPGAQSNETNSTVSSHTDYG